MVPSSFTRERPRTRSWRGLLASVLVHVGLVVAACWIVFRSPLPPPRPDGPSVFVAPAGQSAAGEKEHMVRAQPKANFRPKARLAVNNPNASVALPSLPPVAGNGAGPAAGAKGMGAKGQGFGRGQGFGGPVGSAQRFVGKPVMGATIRAQHVAVYLDCSGSMRPYLARVTAEIRKQYPDADVFQFDGARVVALEESIVHGRNFHGEPPRLTEAPTQTVEAELTPGGRLLQARLRVACEKGSLGAWLDRLLAEKYDALVVFSDFQDGIRVYDEKRKGHPSLIYSDSSFRQVGHALPKGRWQEQWLQAFRKAEQGQGPRLYLFSIQEPPQGFLQRCVEASGGASVDVHWLRSGRRGR
jgi:hypothetical protein